MKQRQTSYLAELYNSIVRKEGNRRSFTYYLTAFLLLVKAFMKGAAYVVLFAPAYVVAYSFRPGFDTDSYLFMIVLGVVSNGLLINYANKFFAFLTAESRKGYVQTAIVKNLSNSYQWKAPDGISYGGVLRPGSLLPSHVFKHIFMNARYQYLPSVKEFASFLITGLIIIEMALNIHGHLGYELLQNILHKQYDVAASIIIGIFLIVKTTELLVDAWFYRESLNYENKRDTIDKDILPA